MIAVDTNVIVRYVTRDEPGQDARTRAFFERHDVYVSLSVLLETEWVLRSTYKLDRPTIDRTLDVLLGSDRVVVEQAERVGMALNGFRSGLDFADALHLAGCPTPQFATFDTELQKRASRAFAEPKVITP